MAGSASPFSTIYAFGDSLSDAGNDSVLTSATGAEPVSPPYYHTNVPILGGIASESATVFSNGPVWVQDLSVPLGLGTLEPSLLGGNDFAYGGAETGNTPQNSGNDTIAAINVPAQLSEFSAVSESNVSTALFTLSIGGNDIFDILSNTALTAAQQATDVSDAVANEVSDIKTMVKDGGKNFLIYNVPNLGLVPDVTLGKANGSNTPSAALDATATALSASYDIQLAAALAGIEASNSVTIKTLDAYTLLTDANQNPSAYGLTNTTTPVWSGNFTSANSGTLATTSAAAQAQYLFWDDFHPTAAVQQILANNAQALVATSAVNQVTVTGAANSTVTLTMASTPLAVQLQTQLTEASIAIGAGSIAAVYVNATTVPGAPSGETGLAELTTGGFLSLPGNYTDAIDVASTAATVISAGAGNQLIVDGGMGGLTYAGYSGVNTVYGGSFGDLVLGGGGTLNFYGGGGAATIIGGTGGNNYVAGAVGNQLIFASSSMTYAGGNGAATIIGGSGALNANMGVGGGLVFGSPNGADTLTAGGGTAILVGGGTGDSLTASGAANDTLIAGAGAETLNASASSGSLVFFGGSGADCIAGGTGNSIFVAGSGNETLNASAGTNAFVFTAIAAGTTRTDVISNFNPSNSAIGLFGYGAEPGADNAALASATTVGGNTDVKLTDGTTIVFTGAPTLQSYNFY
jgi:phospholipase/lecithinase/hemolysin